MMRTVRYALATALAVTLAMPASALARPSAKTASTRPGAHATRSARSAVPAPRSPRPRNLARTGTAAELTPLEQMAEEIRKVWSGRTLRRGTTAVYVVDAQTGDVLYAVNEDRPLNPASNVKLISTATVLDTLGAEWTYLTRILGPAPDPDGVARGDIYLFGSFDPTLSAEHLRHLAAALAASGVKRIDGSLVLGPGPRRDGVGLSRVEVHVTATQPGEPPEVTITPELGFVDLEITAVTTKRRRARLRVATERVQAPDTEATRVAGPLPDWLAEEESEDAPPADTDEPGGHDRLRVIVSGKIRAGRARTYKRWVPQRVQLTAEVLRAALLEAGVEITGGIAREPFEDYVSRALGAAPAFLPVELARHESAPMRDLVAKVNKRSINWLADSLVKTAGAVIYGGDPDLDKGVNAMANWLERAAGIDSASVQIDTGSGLSYKTAITAKHIVRVLRTAGGYLSGAADVPARRAEVYRRSLAVAGRDGTLRRRFRKSMVRGRLIGKTGTLTGIIALAGVLTTDDGNALCFAIVTNQHRRGYRRRVKREHEAMVTAMYRYLEARETGLPDPATATAAAASTVPSEP